VPTGQQSDGRLSAPQRQASGACAVPETALAVACVFPGFCRQKSGNAFSTAMSYSSANCRLTQACPPHAGWQQWCRRICWPLRATLRFPDTLRCPCCLRVRQPVDARQARHPSWLKHTLHLTGRPTGCAAAYSRVVVYRFIAECTGKFVTEPGWVSQQDRTLRRVGCRPAQSTHAAVRASPRCTSRS
jgi:hypothetical protein